MSSTVEMERRSLVSSRANSICSWCGIDRTRASSLAAGWRTWAHRCGDALTLRAQLTNVVAALRRDARRRAIRAWRENAGDRAHEARMKQRAAMALDGSGRTRAWNSWREWATDHALAGRRMRAALGALASQGRARALRRCGGKQLSTRAMDDPSNALGNPKATYLLAGRCYAAGSEGETLAEEYSDRWDVRKTITLRTWRDEPGGRGAQRPIIKKGVPNEEK